MASLAVFAGRVDVACLCCDLSGALRACCVVFFGLLRVVLPVMLVGLFALPVRP